VSRNTVITAYEELTAEGLLEARTGSATRVRGCGRPLVEPDWRAILRASQYPVGSLTFRDPDGNPLRFHR
jgi:DNA-binding transcriptional MocR family regulator